ncbi:RNA polymerase II-specific transcription factor-like protein [Microdochium nivale]|nr:RNA polymerase II-specific transcription factor-like protein [Microdochium nivale]
MARQGSEKGRTGCVTCKRRRVKCDEGRPVCRRCHVGDRFCNYLDPPLGSYSWQYLLQRKTDPPLVRECLSVIGTGRLPPHQARGLDYFRCVVAPALGGHLGDNFWTTPVLQLATSQPAAMHGIQAIGLLYKGFRPSWENGPVSEEAAALRHYNHALRLVATGSDLPVSVVLVTSVLFVCIEFLRGDIAAAITHCRHATLLASSARTDQTSAAAVVVLQHLGIFPHMFSSAEFPLLALEPPRQSRFESVAAAASAMDRILARAIRLVRILDAYRLGANDAALPGDAWTMQQALLRDLISWKTAFEALPPSESYPADTADAGQALLRMRFLVGWVWTSIATSRDETASDVFRAEFTEIVKLAKSATQGQVKQPRFLFNMGTTPLLHFVVIKCRHLPTRLEALGMLRGLAQVRESVWDAETMYAIGKCIIEHEHGICLYVDGVLSAVSGGELPGDESRIRDSYVEDKLVEHTDERGNRVLRRRIHLMFVAGGVVVEKLDWISSPVVLEA